MLDNNADKVNEIKEIDWLIRNTRDSMIYFVQHGKAGPVKIGRSRNLRQRILSLQQGNPFELRLIYKLPGDFQFESKLHKKFSKYHLGNKWYSPCEEIFDFLREIATNC